MRRQKTKNIQGFTLLELMVCVAVTGILAAVAVPAYMKYVRRSRTVEAVMNTRKLTEGALAYFMSEHADNKGAILQRQFPACLGPYFPLLGTCCNSPGRKCAPSSSIWTDPSLIALNFSIDDPFYYSYSADSGGSRWGSVKFDVGGGKVADCLRPGLPGETMAYGAFGDLNCNGTYSVYMRTVTVDNTYTPRVSSGLLTQNELE